MPHRYVLDASAGVNLLQRTRDGEALASTVHRGGDVELWTVEHFHLEVARVFRRDTLQRVITDEQSTILVASLAAWPLDVVSVAPLLEEAWQLRHNVTVHDALYVVLTRHLDGATLVSTDTRLSNAPGVDVPIITPDRLSS